jgi:hypothetical protein
MQSSENPVLVQLEVSVEGTHLVAKLVFVNQSAESFYVERAKAQPSHTLDYNLFHIFDGEERLAFTGRLAKRPPPTLEEFVPIPPMSRIESTVQLDRSYDFPRGAHEYRIFYQAVNSSRGEQPLFKLISNQVTIEYRR